jgi:excisionase family DNA binding protein
MSIPRMRLINEAYEEIKAKDPNTAITRYFIRDLAVSGKITTSRAGRKYLINMDMLEEYLSNPEPTRPEDQEPIDGIRNIRRIG